MRAPSEGGERPGSRADLRPDHARLQMVDNDLHARGVRDPRVLEAMSTLPRERFVGPALRDEAYSDRPLPIGHGQTISQPLIVAMMVEALELRRYRDEEGRELLDLADGVLPDPETPAPVRFLPVWDATLLVHARRTQILPEEFRNLVFHTKNPQSVNTFLVDGSVAGSWRYEPGRIAVQPFRTIPRTVLGELEAEAERLGAFYA